MSRFPDRAVAALAELLTISNRARAAVAAITQSFILIERTSFDIVDCQVGQNRTGGTADQYAVQGIIEAQESLRSAISDWR